MIIPKRPKLLICAAGIFVCYFYYGILQEKVTRSQYGDGEEKERFTYMLALVFFQFVVNYIFAKILLRTVMNEPEDTTRTIYYATSSLAYFLAMVSSNMALRFINYPTQVIGKAGKPIPVMILGVLLGKKVYPARKYFFVFLIVLGMVLFMLKNDCKTSGQEDKAALSFGIGEFLLLLSLTMDGLISAAQERMRSEHQTRSGALMLNMNLWSIIFSGAVILLTGELIQFVQFLQRHPEILWHISTLALAGGCGQYFIFLTVADFGPLPCSIITTTRKFFTVLGSVIIFGNSLLPLQWVATLVVFTGLLLDALYGKNKPAVKKDTVK